MHDEGEFPIWMSCILIQSFHMLDGGQKAMRLTRRRAGGRLCAHRSQSNCRAWRHTGSLVATRLLLKWKRLRRMTTSLRWFSNQSFFFAWFAFLAHPHRRHPMAPWLWNHLHARAPGAPLQTHQGGNETAGAGHHAQNSQDLISEAGWRSVATLEQAGTPISVSPPQILFDVQIRVRSR